MSAEMPKERRCPVNRCGRPVGIGTHMEVVGVSGITERLSVCEDHWQANRDIFPLPASSVGEAAVRGTRT